MSSDALPTVELRSVSAHDAASLRTAIVRGLIGDDGVAGWADESPRLTQPMRSSLGPGHLDTLVRANLVRSDGGEPRWNFQPFFGNGLLLFRDLECRRFEREFVWLQTSTDSLSWSLPDSVQIRAGMRVLDLGCGSGLNALRAALKGAVSTGIDINPRAINVAELNKRLNGLDTARFVHSDWRDFEAERFDLVISQPPFDPVLPGTANQFAFGGGAGYGLELTEALLSRFQPRHSGQTSQIYVHSFIERGSPLLGGALSRTLSEECSYSLALKKRHSIAAWWAKYKARHDLPVATSLPEEWARFSEVHAYFLTISRRAERQLRAV